MVVPVVERLKSIFAIHGVPQKIFTANGPSFVSEEFTSEWHYTYQICPYHPSTNGLAKTAVQTFKQGLLHQKVGTID